MAFLEHQHFSYLWTGSETLALPGSWACRHLDGNYAMGSSGSRSFRLTSQLHCWLSGVYGLLTAALGTCKSAQSREPIPNNNSPPPISFSLYIHVYVHIYTHVSILFVLSLWRILTIPHLHRDGINKKQYAMGHSIGLQKFLFFNK